MKYRLAFLSLAMVTTAACATTPTGSDSTPAQAATGAVNADQKVPDLTGIWERHPDPYGALDYPPPPGGPPPLREPYLTRYNQAIAKRDATLARGELADDPSVRCLPEGMPTIMGGTYALEVVQSPHQVVVLAEYLTQTRRIYIGKTMPPAEEIFPSYNGYSVAHWEGDTLVVSTRGIRETVEFLWILHSAEIEITERIRLVSPDRLEDEVTITDPKVLERPYSFTFGYRRMADYQIPENICDNNRYDVDQSGQPNLDTDRR